MSAGLPRAPTRRDLRRAVDPAGGRYRGRTSIPATLVTGAASGALNGASGLAGPPVVFYYLSGGAAAPEVRASFIVYFALIDAVSVAWFAFNGAINGITLLRAAW